MSLGEYGWEPFFARSFERAVAGQPGADRLEPARLVAPGRGLHRLVADGGEVRARPAGRLRERPAVGDWAVLERTGGDEAVLRELLPRKSKLGRKVAGHRTEEQVLAANVDIVLLVMGLDGDFNLRRVERLAVVAREGGVDPVVVLTKADLLPEPELAARREEVLAVAPGVPVLATSVRAGTGLEPLHALLAPGVTLAMLGSSGAGKSSLLNRLSGREVMRTGAVREGDSRGRHTTVHRELVRLPGGSLLIDSPGLREVQLWTESGEALEETFEDVAALAAACRFGDCAHRGEPGCAVRAALDDGRLAPSRLAAWRELQEEAARLDRRRDEAAARRHGRTGSLAVRQAKKEKADRGKG